MKYAVMIALLLSMGLAIAKEAQPMVGDTVLEQKIHDLSKELRCLKCQNQSIFDSKSGFADQIRGELRDQFQEGKTDQEIKAFLTDRYGDFIVYEPPFTLANMLVWEFPVALLIIAILVLVTAIRKQQGRTRPEATVSDEQSERVKKLLSKGES